MTDVLPSRFQLRDQVRVQNKLCHVVGVTFALVDFHDGWGEGGKIYYTVEFPDGKRTEVMSNDVSQPLVAV